MKQIFFYLALILVMISCYKDEIPNQSKINLSFIVFDENILKLININLETTVQHKHPVNCYITATSTFEHPTLSLGYYDCNGFFKLVNPITGVLTNEVFLNEIVCFTVIDSKQKCLIGRIHQGDSNQIIKVSLESGEIIAKNTIHFDHTIYNYIYFFNQNLNRYMLITTDNILRYINPDNGMTTKSVYLESVVFPSFFDEKHNRIIGLKKQYGNTFNIVTINASTGKLLNSVEVSEHFRYDQYNADYDPVTNSLVVESFEQYSTDNYIKFINIETGKIVKSYKIQYPFSEFFIWRSE